jgi:hypothetical protein
MNTDTLLATISQELRSRDAQIAMLTDERDSARLAYNHLQSLIDAAQTQVPNPSSPLPDTPPALTGTNTGDLSSWSHTGVFASMSSSFEVQRFDGSDWVAIGTGMNNGDVCRIRSVSGDNVSPWVEFNA